MDPIWPPGQQEGQIQEDEAMGIQEESGEVHTPRSFSDLPEELFRYVVQLACKLPPVPVRWEDMLFGSVPSSSPRGISTTTSSPLDVSTCLNLLLSDRRCHDIVLPLLYRDVTLVRPSKLVAFARTLMVDPKRGLLVRSLWIGPLGAPQRMPRLVYLGHDLLTCALPSPRDSTGETSLSSHPLKDYDSRLMGHLRHSVASPLFRRIVERLLDVYPQVPGRGFPASVDVESVEQLSEPTREQWLAAPLLGMSSWILRAEMTQSALQFVALVAQEIGSACYRAMLDVVDELGFEGNVERLDDEKVRIALERAEQRKIEPGLLKLLTSAPYEPYLDLFVWLTSRADVKPSVAASLVGSRLLHNLTPRYYWRMHEPRQRLAKLYGRRRDCREDDFGSHLLYARSGQARLLIPDSSVDPMSTGIEEADVDEASDRASDVEDSDEGRDEEDGGTEHDDAQNDDDDDDEQGGNEENNWASEPPHSARAARKALDRADRFGPRSMPWSGVFSYEVVREAEAIVKELKEEERNEGAKWSLGSLLATTRGVLSLTPMLRCLAVSGFLERAVAGERGGAALKNLRHLSIGPPPANWSAPLLLRSLSSSLRSIDVSGCMLFDEEVSDLVGLEGSLPNLAEITWRLWLPHSSNHALTAAQTVRRMLDLQEARRALTRGSSGGGGGASAKEPRRRKVHAVLHDLDIVAVRQALNIPLPPPPGGGGGGATTQVAGAAMRTTSTTAAPPQDGSAPSVVGVVNDGGRSRRAAAVGRAGGPNAHWTARLRLSTAPTDLAPNIVATRARFASKAGFGPRLRFGHEEE